MKEGLNEKLALGISTMIEPINFTQTDFGLRL
jgi:hypothetical protein